MSNPKPSSPENTEASLARMMREEDDRLRIKELRQALAQADENVRVLLQRIHELEAAEAEVERLRGVIVLVFGEPAKNVPIEAHLACMAEERRYFCDTTARLRDRIAEALGILKERPMVFNNPGLLNALVKRAIAALKGEDTPT